MKRQKKTKDYSREARLARQKKRRIIKRLINDLHFIITIILVIVAISIVGDLKLTNLQNEELKNNIKEGETTITQKDEEIDDLEEKIKGLKIDYEEYNNLLKRKELFDEYEYCLFDDAGNRTDITYDQLEHGISLMEANGIDPDLLFSIIMVESNGRENAANSNSSAKGYCQLIASTGKSMYESIGNRGTYRHETMAFDGKLNMEMGVELISRNMEKYNGDVNKVLCLYTGSNPVNPGYYKKLNHYLDKAGTSLSEIQANYKKPTA